MKTFTTCLTTQGYFEYVINTDARLDALKQRAFASGSIADGYFDDRTPCLFSTLINLDGTLNIVVVLENGFIAAGLSPVLSESEALWRIQNMKTIKNVKGVPQ